MTPLHYGILSSRRRVAWLGVVVFLMLTAVASAQDLAVPGPGPVGPASERDGRAGAARIGEIIEPPPRRGYTEDVWTKRAPVHASASQPAAVPAEDQAAAEAPGLITTFDGVDFSGSIPPDGAIAAGPSTLILVTNGSLTIRDKGGNLVASTALTSFFAAVRQAAESSFDPRAIYDPGSGRFFVSTAGKVTNALCTAGVNCIAHFFVAVSKSSTPATTGSADWFFYGLDATLDGSTPTANWADFPSLGLDGSVVVVTANMFSFRSSAFQYAKVRILNKSTLMAGGSQTWVDFFNLKDPITQFPSFTLQPAITFGAPSAFFLMSKSRASGSCDMIVRGIANPLSAPLMTTVLVPAAGGICTAPPNALQLGGGTPLDSGDTRLNNLVYRNGSLWAAQGIDKNFGSGDVAAIRWVQVNVSGWPGMPSIVQDGTFGQDATWFMFPEIMLDASNNVGVAFTRSSATEFGSAYYTGRLASDAPSTLEPSALLKAGAATYVRLDSDGSNRWGDYSAIALDPVDGSFWTFAEYAVTSTTWGMWAGKFPPANPVPVIGSLSPSAGTSNGTAFTLTVIGGNFTSSSVVRWNGASRPTTFVNSTQIQATIAATDVSTAVTAQVTVFNPAPGGGASNARMFVVSASLQEAFVTGLYLDVLARPPDPSGLASWVSFLDGNCNLQGFQTIGDSFFDSEEFRTVRPLTLTDLVTVLYNAFLQRAPDPSGLAGWADVFRQARVAMALQGFIPSAEFQAILPNRADPNAVTPVVTRFYTDMLGRSPDPTELASWVNFIVTTGQLEQAAATFLTSAEFEARPLTFRDYVTILYLAFLNREPDSSGLDAWEQVLRDTLLQVINTGFVPSSEFQQEIHHVCG